MLDGTDNVSEEDGLRREVGDPTTHVESLQKAYRAGVVQTESESATMWGRSDRPQSLASGSGSVVAQPRGAQLESLI